MQRRRDGVSGPEDGENDELIELYTATLHRLEVEVLKLRRQMAEQEIVPPPMPFAMTSLRPHIGPSDQGEQ
jgi:hypothetical protein